MLTFKESQMKISSFLFIAVATSVAAQEHYPHIHTVPDSRPNIEPWTISAQTTTFTITLGGPQT